MKTMCTLCVFECIYPDTFYGVNVLFAFVFSGAPAHLPAPHLPALHFSLEVSMINVFSLGFFCSQPVEISEREISVHSVKTIFMGLSL